MIRAAKGDTVKVRYTGRLKDGTVFDSSPADRPLLFILGRGEVIPGFDEETDGMFSGEKKTFTIPPEKAYGPHDERFVEELDREVFPEGLDLQIGRQLEVTNEKGDRLLVMVTAMGERTVTLDGNHPLAGKDLTFEIELLEVTKPPAPPSRPAATPQ